MTCGMCAKLCWRCTERLARLKDMLEAMEKRGASLEVAFLGADDTERDEIAEQLSDNVEECWSLREEIDDLEGGENFR